MLKSIAMRITTKSYTETKLAEYSFREIEIPLIFPEVGRFMNIWQKLPVAPGIGF